MPYDRSKYPPDWEQIVARIKERDGHKCKVCGVANYAIGYWEGEQFVEVSESDVDAKWYDGHKIIKIVLTCAHLNDSDPMNVDDDNLAMLCNRHHNRLDAPMRAKHAAETRRRKKAKLQMSLEVNDGQ